MIKKRILIAGYAAIALVSVFGISMNTLSKQEPPGHPPTVPQARRTIPEHIVYGFIFRKVSIITNKTKELKALGRIGRKPYFALQKDAKLSDS